MNPGLLTNADQNWTTFKAVVGVLSALGLGVSLFVAVVGSKVAGLDQLQQRVTSLSAEVSKLENQKA